MNKLDSLCWGKPVLIERNYLDGLLPGLEENIFKASENQQLWEQYEQKKSEMTAFMASSSLENIGRGFVPVRIIDGIAVMSLYGPVMQRIDGLKWMFSGGFGTIEAERKVKILSESEEIKGIILDIDSPGGTVSGTENLADTVLEARKIKSVVALANCMACSAAYWIASAAAKLYIAGNTAQVGSIGVLTVHRDYSGANQKMGITITELAAGEFKTVGSPNKPLSERDQQILMAQLNEIYGVFVSAVAKNRGVDKDQVLQKMADGRVFMGERAISSGLADGIKSLDQIISEERTKVVMSNEQIQVPQVQHEQITSAMLKEKHPAVYSEIYDSGMKAERKRVGEIMTVLETPGVSALPSKSVIAQMKAAVDNPQANAGSVAIELLKSKEIAAKCEGGIFMNALRAESQTLNSANVGEIDEEGVRKQVASMMAGKK